MSLEDTLAERGCLMGHTADRNSDLQQQNHLSHILAVTDD